MGKNKGVSTEFLVKSVGLAAHFGANEKKSRIVIAYAAEKISFAVAPFPSKGKLFSAEDAFAAIADAEGADAVRYTDGENAPLDLYVCRARAGRAADFVPRDGVKNKYLPPFAEIAMGDPPFSVEKCEQKGSRLLVSLSSVPAKYAEDSFEYALLNAYNACLLGLAFGREELNLRTREKRRVRVEVRADGGEFDTDTLIVRPVAGEYADKYETEQFHFIDGEEASRRSYKIAFSGRMNGYFLTRR